MLMARVTEAGNPTTNANPHKKQRILMVRIEVPNLNWVKGLSRNNKTPTNNPICNPESANRWTTPAWA